MTQYPNVHPGTNGTSASRTAATTNLSEKEFVTRLQETADLHGARRPAQRFSAEELTNALQAFQTASVEQTGTLPLGTIQHVFSLPDAQVVSLAWSPNEKRLALVHNGCVSLYTVESKKITAFYAPHVYYKQLPASMTSVAWSPDGKLLACSRSDGRVEVRDTETGKPVFLYEGHAAPVRHVAWSNGTRIASSDDEGSVHIWDVHSRCRVYNYLADNQTGGKSTRVTTLVWSADSKYLAAGCNNGLVSVSDLNKLYPATSSLSAVNALAWSPHGTSIALGGSNSQAGSSGHVLVYLFTQNPTQWRYNASPSHYGVAHTYTRHRGAVQAVAWSPDGKRIASASEDGTIQVWDCHDGNNVFTFRVHPAPVTCLAWARERNWIASVDEHGIVLVWQAG